jgi:hypothetical protein
MSSNFVTTSHADLRSQYGASFYPTIILNEREPVNHLYCIVLHLYYIKSESW